VIEIDAFRADSERGQVILSRSEVLLVGRDPGVANQQRGHASSLAVIPPRTASLPAAPDEGSFADGSGRLSRSIGWVGDHPSSAGDAIEQQERIAQCRGAGSLLPPDATFERSQADLALGSLKGSDCGQPRRIRKPAPVEDISRVGDDDGGDCVGIDSFASVGVKDVLGRSAALERH
jgi:hypothetical protein